jgi:hypothetical protein
MEDRDTLDDEALEEFEDFDIDPEEELDFHDNYVTGHETGYIYESIEEEVGGTADEDTADDLTDSQVADLFDAEDQEYFSNGVVEISLDDAFPFLGVHGMHLEE